MKELAELRKRLHRYPELAHHEERTAQTVVAALEQLRPDKIVTGIGGYGVAAVFKGEKTGSKVLVRCELDGLPIPDSKNVVNRSEHEGIGHKCGHDGHMVILLGLAQKLAQTKPERGEVILLFQPAEETGEGAELVLKDSKFKALQPDYAIALHNLPGFPLGQVILKKDVFASTSCGMEIKLVGRTSHAAEPEQGISPALAVAQLIQHFSALAQFHTSLDQAAQITIIHAQVGERAFGTSPGFGTVAVTIRAHSDQVMKLLKEKIESFARSTADMFSLSINVKSVEPFPVTVNNDDVVDVIERSADELKMQTHYPKVPFAWSEDFGHFTARYPGALFGLGSGERQPALHHPDYDFPDQLIKSGVELFETIIKNLNK